MKKIFSILILIAVCFTGYTSAQKKDFTGHIANSMAFTKDGKRLYTGGWDMMVKVWDMETGKAIKTLHIDEFVNVVCLTPDEKNFAVASYKGLYIYDASTFELIRSYEGGERVYGADYSPDGKYIAAKISRGREDGIVIWDASSGSEVKQLRGFDASISCIKFSPDSKLLASTGSDGIVRLWDVEKGSVYKELTDKGWIESVSFSPDGKSIASGGADMTIKIWDIKSGECIKTLTGHEAKVLYVNFSPDGNYIASSSEDYTAKLWDITTGQCIETYADHEYFVWAVSFTPDYKFLATSSGDKTIKFRELKRRGTEIFITSETKSELSMNIPKTGKANNDAIAVVIGNKNYKKDVPPVEFAFTDASVTKDYLINTLGYKEENIIFLKDATQSDLISAFGSDNDHKGRLYDLVKPGKSDVFVYYSGHGAPDPQTKSAFIVPVDCEPNKVTLNGFSLATFYKNLGKLEYKSLTVVIDACFSGGSDAGMIIQNASPIFITTSEESTDMNTKKNSVIFTSSKGEQISSWYRDKGHSLFTYYFLLALGGEGDSDKDGKLTAKEISKFVDENVPSQARKLYSRDQNPQVNGDRDMIIVEY